MRKRLWEVGEWWVWCADLKSPSFSCHIRATVSWWDSCGSEMHKYLLCKKAGWPMPLISVLGRQSPWISRSLRPACCTYGDPGQSRIHSETCFKGKKERKAKALISATVCSLMHSGLWNVFCWGCHDPRLSLCPCVILGMWDLQVFLVSLMKSCLFCFWKASDQHSAACSRLSCF